MASGKTVPITAMEFDDRGCEPMLLFWYVSEGETVAEGQDLCEIESAKGVFVIPAPAAGAVASILVRETEPVTSGQELGALRVEVAGGGA